MIGRRVAQNKAPTIFSQKKLRKFGAGLKTRFEPPPEKFHTDFFSRERDRRKKASKFSERIGRNEFGKYFEMETNLAKNKFESEKSEAPKLEADLFRKMGSVSELLLLCHKKKFCT